jgi:DNA polymerase-3 subunit delta'
MMFKSVIGQETVRDQLIKSAREKRVSHALLFHGPPGCGKFALALSFAQYLNCSDPGSSDSCGVCPSCLKAKKNIHPDIHFIFPVANIKANTKPVSDHFLEDWREYLGSVSYPDLPEWLGRIKVENKQAGIFRQEAESILHKLSLKAFESDYKVVIVWFPEKMNPSAANALLKIIEEPPDNTVFLMVAESTEEIIPTILSRTQLVRVNKIGDNPLREYLSLQFPGMEKAVNSALRLADGNYPMAVRLIEEDEQMRFYMEHFTTWMRLAFNFKVLELLDWIPSIAEIGRERQKDFFSFCLRLIRGNFHMNRNVMSIARLSPTEEDFSLKFNRFVNPDNIEDYNRLFSEAISHISMNANPRILLMDMSSSLFRLMRRNSG